MKIKIFKINLLYYILYSIIFFNKKYIFSKTLINSFIQAILNLFKFSKNISLSFAPTLEFTHEFSSIQQFKI